MKSASPSLPACYLKPRWTEPYQVANGVYETLMNVGRDLSHPVERQAAFDNAVTVFNIISLASLEITKQEGAEFVEFVDKPVTAHAAVALAAEEADDLPIVDSAGAQEPVKAYESDEPSTPAEEPVKTSESHPTRPQKMVGHTGRGRPRMYDLCAGSNKAPESEKNGMGQCSNCNRRTHLDNGMVKQHVIK